MTDKTRDAAALEAKLLPEPALCVLPSLATAVGLNQAIVLQQVHYRCRVRAEGWWRAPLAELRDEFPFWSEATIKRVLASLGRDGFLESRQVGTDRTKHYRIEYAALGKRVRLQGVQGDPLEGVTSASNRSDAAAQSDPIPIDRKKNSKRINEPTSSVATSSVASLCRLLADLIVARDAKAKIEPDGDRWRTDMRLLIERDGRSATDVERVIRWCQDDGFWRRTSSRRASFESSSRPSGGR